LAGGVRVVSTPGHTPGHLCLYLERSRTLIAGDALLAHRGRVYGPSSEFSANLPAARGSVRKLAELDVRAIVCYHGGVVNDDANGQLRRMAAAGGGVRRSCGRWAVPTAETAKVHLEYCGLFRSISTERGTGSLCPGEQNGVGAIVVGAIRHTVGSVGRTDVSERRQRIRGEAP
jgi:hypothetical protein